MSKSRKKAKVRIKPESGYRRKSGRKTAMNVAAIAPRSQPGRRGSRYLAPAQVRTRGLRDLIEWSGRGALDDAQLTLLSGRRDDPDIDVFFAGDAELLRKPCVSIVGTREVSDQGWARARRLARELAKNDVVVVSGLARGVDTAALTGAIEADGHVVAIIGTPVDKAYPAENAELQQQIYSEHLLVSPFPSGERVFPSNFPKRNRVMAALSDATVIVEASDTSGTLHQAAECQRLGRWLFIMRAVAEDRSLKWPAKFIGKHKVAVLSTTADILCDVRRP
jgi:DNA protecting protein DprA